MERKNFSVKVLNSFVGKGFFENGVHYGTDQEILDWFLGPDQKKVWENIPDIEIKEERPDAEPVNRMDLVMRIIKPRTFTDGERVRPVFFDPLLGNTEAPPLVPEEEYLIKRIFIDSAGNQHLDIGLESKFNHIRSYATKEDLPDGDKIHWCHPGRLELVK